MSARELMRTINEKNVPNQQRDIGQRLEIAERATAVRPVPSDYGPPHLVNGRLTLSSGVPVTTSNVTSAGTIYFTPHLGDCITLYNSTSLSWVVRRFGEAALSLTGLTASTLYNVYGYWTGQNLALETSATGTATQDGRLVKSGDPARLYLGALYTSGTGVTEESLSNRYISNLYNQKERLLQILHTDSHSVTATSWQPWNNSATARVRFVSMGEQPIRYEWTWSASSSSGNTSYMGIGVDSTTTANGYSQTASTSTVRLFGGNAVQISAGYHYLSINEFVSGGTSSYGSAILTAFVLG